MSVLEPAPAAVGDGRRAAQSRAGDDFLASRTEAVDREYDRKPAAVPRTEEPSPAGPVDRHDGPGDEQYEHPIENRFLPVAKCPLSTFSIDVDTASYANVRRFLSQGRLPPREAVRIEEMVNYFQYEYPEPKEGQPFSVAMEVAQCPWNGEHRLVRSGLKGRSVDRAKRGPSNLVFLLDVSGSMAEPNKLSLVQQAMKMLTDELGENDHVSIVTYSETVRLALESTNGTQKQRIRETIDGLRADGSTNGAGGIQMAYEQAKKNFIREGVNRVILATDGDFNVGITNDDELVRFIQQQATSGVFLTVLGVGEGNLKDAKMQKLADKGNGVYAYLDSLREARKVLVEQMSGTLVTIAKDVKIQVEFNPAEVAAYRLVGYEKRLMAARDFRDDRKDAGEIGAGHTVTALYEVVSARPAGPDTGGQSLKYQRVPEEKLATAAGSGEMLTLRLRYKKPHGQEASETEFALKDAGKRLGEASADYRFATAVAMFGMLLKDSQHAGDATWAAVEEIASSSLGSDPRGYRAEMLDMVRRAKQIRP